MDAAFIAYNTISFRFSISMRPIYIVGKGYYSKKNPAKNLAFKNLLG